MHLCSILNFAIVLVFVHSFIYFFVKMILKLPTERAMVAASPNFICHFFMRAIPKRLTFGLWLYMIYVCKMCMFCVVFNLCKILFSKKSRGDPVGWLGITPSINNNNNNNNNNLFWSSECYTSQVLYVLFLTILCPRFRQTCF